MRWPLKGQCLTYFCMPNSIQHFAEKKESYFAERVVFLNHTSAFLKTSFSSVASYGRIKSFLTQPASPCILSVISGLRAHSAPAFFQLFKYSKPVSTSQPFAHAVSLSMECLSFPVYTPWLISTHLSGICLNVRSLKMTLLQPTTPKSNLSPLLFFLFIVHLGGCLLF